MDGRPWLTSRPQRTGIAATSSSTRFHWRWRSAVASRRIASANSALALIVAVGELGGRVFERRMRSGAREWNRSRRAASVLPESGAGIELTGQVAEQCGPGSPSLQVGRSTRTVGPSSRTNQIAFTFNNDSVAGALQPISFKVLSLFAFAGLCSFHIGLYGRSSMLRFSGGHLLAWLRRIVRAHSRRLCLQALSVDDTRRSQPASTECGVLNGAFRLVELREVAQLKASAGSWRDPMPNFNRGDPLLGAVLLKILLT